MAYPPTMKKPTFEEIWDTEFFQKHAIAAIHAATETFQTSLESEFERCVRRCESPLEAAFAAWWLALARTESWDFNLNHQFEVIVGGETFRVDLVPATTRFGEAYNELQTPPKIAIELDGHDFHERTKEQVTYRNRRDRVLAGAGWLVLHYSGSEFHRDPMATVRAAYLDCIGAYAKRMFAEGLWGHKTDGAD